MTKAYDCAICYSTFQQENIILCTNKKHPICFKCLKDHIITGIDEGIKKTKCIVGGEDGSGGCDGIYIDSDIGKVLNKEQKIMYDRLEYNFNNKYIV
jgi:hypothetical protein